MSFHSGGWRGDDLVRGVIFLITIVACIICAYLIAGKAGIIVLAVTPFIMWLGYQGTIIQDQYARGGQNPKSDTPSVER